MKIKDSVETKAQQLQSRLAAQAQVKYVHWIMREEGIDSEEAWAIVEGRTDPREPELILGYRLSDPVVVMALFMQHSAKRRQQAAENFAAGLEDDLKDLFWKEVFTEKNRLAYIKKWKAEKKAAKQ